MIDAYTEIKRVSLMNAFINTLLAILKIAIGGIGHSQALIADGLHSFSDLLTDALALAAGKAGSKKPDTEHPYGHRRIETLGTIVIAIILVSVGVGLGYENLEIIFIHQSSHAHSPLVLLVAVISIFTNEWRYRYTLKISENIHSPLLEANAWHTRSDALVSLVVVISVLGAYVGIPYMDAMGAILIALFILKMGIWMVWQAVGELIDSAADHATIQAIEAQIRQIPGIKAIHQLRTRKLGGSVFVDVHVIVDPFISVSEGHYLGECVVYRLLKNVSNVADVTAHVDSENDETVHPCTKLPNRTHLTEELRIVWKNLPEVNYIQRIILHYLGGRIYVELFFPIGCQKRNSIVKEDYLKTAKTIAPIESVKIFYSE